MTKKTASAIPALSLEARLKRNIRRHLKSLGFQKRPDGSLERPAQDKSTVRSLHQEQRKAVLREHRDFLASSMPTLAQYFADGSDLDPERIRFQLERVRPGTREANLFRLASLTWSVPVSAGYGRRLRYLVWDTHAQRLAGLIALGDPVFNLTVRDSLIGWSSAERAKRLVNILDAYVLGALPPYNFLLGGKAIACLVRSREIFDDFNVTYGKSTGLISGEEKHAKLLAVTTSSSLGRSSVYNRLKLDGVSYYTDIGYTQGWGHFHIPEQLFASLRNFLRTINHPYADQHRFGSGPNWRLRTIREGLKLLGLSEDLLRHGIKRQVFMSQLADNALPLLRKGTGRVSTKLLKTVDCISELATDRWIKPRSLSRPDFRNWSKEQLKDLLTPEGQIKNWPASTLNSALRD